MAGKPKPPEKRTVVNGVSLVPEDWTFLKALAAELQAAQDTTGDPIIGGGRATASAAIRWLIEQERRKPKRQRGSEDEVYFDAGGGNVRVLSRSTASTTVSSGEVVLFAEKPTAKKSAKKPTRRR